MSSNRVRHAFFSSSASFITQLILLLLKFLTRGVVLQILGIKMLGLNQTFVNFVIVFSLAELGVIQSLDFLLYKSLAHEDHSRTAALYIIYRKIYLALAVLVILVGFGVSFLLPVILKDDINIPNIYLIWGIFVLSSASSYLLRGKRPILEADQRQYIIALTEFTWNIIMLSLQITSLFIFKSFIVYIIINFFCQLGSMSTLMIISNKIYKHIDTYPPSKITKKDISDIKRVAFGGLIQHGAAAATTAISTAFLAYFQNVDQNGLYGNYILITGGVTLLFQKLSAPMLPAIGQANALSDENGQYSLFKKYLFFTFSLSIFALPATFNCLSPLISIWIGKQYILSTSIVLAISLNLLIAILLNPVTLFQITFGIQWEIKTMAISNLILNLFFIITLIGFLNLGIIGIPLGTFLSSLLTSFWFVAKIEYKFHFKRPFIDYFKLVLPYFFQIIFLIILSKIVLIAIDSQIHSGLLTLFFNAGISLLVSSCYYLLFFRKNEELHAIFEMIKSKLLKK